MAMEGGESALDVLSRAATMLQEQSPIITTDEPKHSANKQLPTTKWKRDRRTRPEYTRRSDPKLPDGFLGSTNGGGGGSPPRLQDSSVDSPNSSSSSSSSDSCMVNGNGRASDAPLDMSVRQRGLPPSYNQAISDPSFRSSYRAASGGGGGGGAAVVASPPPAAPLANGSHRDELPSGISMCDPIIDEHFRRSLGKDYMAVFNNNNTTTSKDTARTSPSPPQPAQSPPKAVTPVSHITPVSPHVTPVSPPPVTGTVEPPASTRQVTTTVSDLMDGGGMSVDDHFAKALGDTWFKLNGNKKENGASVDGLVVKGGGGGGVDSMVTI